MKKLIIITTLLYSINGIAATCGETKTETQVQKREVEAITEVPSHLKGATITLTKADGSVEVLKAEQYMIVKRKHVRPIITEKVVTSKIQCQNESVKNIVSLRAVNSFGDIDKDSTSSSATLRNSKKRTIGGQYQRNVGKDVFIGVDGDLNRNAGLSVGIGF